MPAKAGGGFPGLALAIGALECDVVHCSSFGLLAPDAGTQCAIADFVRGLVVSLGFCRLLRSWGFGFWGFAFHRDEKLPGISGRRGGFSVRQVNSKIEFARRQAKLGSWILNRPTFCDDLISPWSFDQRTSVGICQPSAPTECSPGGHDRASGGNDIIDKEYRHRIQWS